MVNDEWMAETAEVKAQVEELRDVSPYLLIGGSVGRSDLGQVLEGREQDLKDLREVLVERDEELGQANERVADLQANQSETHDRLEETLKNIERDNAEKDADLIAANREIEAVGQLPFLPFEGSAKARAETLRSSARGCTSWKKRSTSSKLASRT